MARWLDHELARGDKPRGFSEPTQPTLKNAGKSRRQRFSAEALTSDGSAGRHGARARCIAWDMQGFPCIAASARCPS
jgi:hypothetical protein